MEEKTFTYRQPFPLESGDTLAGLELAYATWGELRYDEQGNTENVIWICHALTANANAADWWEGLVGPGKLFDPKDHFIICCNVLGSCYGSTNSLSINPLTGEPYYHDFPLVTIRDIVQALDLLRVSLGINAIKLCTGGSLGGQQALEWAITQPEIFEQVGLIACNAFHSPWGVAFNESQRMAIENDPSWPGKHPDAGLEGMKVARSIALLSYRNYDAYSLTQLDDNPEKLENYRASSYQKYQGEKLARRFHAFAYWYLSKAMDTHHVGRGRGGIEKALCLVKARTLVIGIGTDILFPISEQKLLASCIRGAQLHIIDSAYGHDGFLIEHEKITSVFRQWQELSEAGA